METLYIDYINLHQVGPYVDVRLQFHRGLNLICGPNGVGKTTVLDAIAAPFGAFFGGTKIKRRVLSEGDGIVSLSIFDEGRSEISSATLSSHDPLKEETIPFFREKSERLINIRSNRDFSYQRQAGINADLSFELPTIGTRNIEGINSSEIKQWITNRYLLFPHGELGGWTKEMLENLETAKNLFSILDQRVSLHSVNVNSFDVIAKTPDGNVPFEYLSSGFRSMFALLLGIIKEIEYRKLSISAQRFSGVILIDEVDLHLHPTWQRAVPRILKETFPSAQIIAATHSPHVIQAAEACEVIALGRSNDGEVYVRDLPASEFGYAGWSVEEVLTDIMGMPSVTTEVYDEAMEAFDRAVDEENASETKKRFAQLSAMLHPSSPIRTILELRAAPVTGIDQ